MLDSAPLQPYDESNETLERNVHPPDWENPQVDGRYNLVVIGAGTAGLVTAAGAAGMGAKVALVGRRLNTVLRRQGVGQEAQVAQ